MDNAALLDVAIKAAVDAGQATLGYRRKNLEVHHKDDLTPVTAADRAAHRIILQHLDEALWGIPVLSEEGEHLSYAERRRWHSFWLIDPLDGTKEFLLDGGEFTVNIALLNNRLPAIGVVYVPATDVLFAGTVTSGAFVMEGASAHRATNRQTTALPRENRDHRPVTVTVSKSHNTPQTDAFIDVMRQAYGEVEVKRASSALKICQLADGVADFYPRYGPTMEWDTAAGDAILRAVGGRVVRARDGRRLIYNKRDLHNPDFVAVAPGRRVPSAARYSPTSSPTWSK
jgi:3'(2'), 5'-bisphosphate nucleotidase